MTFDKNQTVREIAIKKPAAVRVFESFRIDYCCGGKSPLQQACQRANAAIDKVLQALDKLETPNIAVEERPWTQCSLADLTAHIVGRHNRYARDKAPRIEELLQKVVNRPGDAHPELGATQETFVALSQELLAPIMKEECVLFPFLAEIEIAAREGRTMPPGCFASVGMPISRMPADHAAAGALLTKMRVLSGSIARRMEAVPASAGCISSGRIRAHLHRHIHLENNILFPRATEIERSLQETAHVLH
jgi:regulator of cell morphogenesis and NO signaling